MPSATAVTPIIRNLLLLARATPFNGDYKVDVPIGHDRLAPQSVSGCGHVHLSQPIFHDEKAAYAFLEAVLWPDGPTCPHCGAIERIYKLKGKSTRIGVHKC